MTLQRIDPFRDFWQWDTPAGLVRRNIAPRARAAPSDDSIVVRASLPGFKAENIEVSVDDGVLSISAETEAIADADGEGYLLRERRSGKFRRALKLPDTVDVDQAESTYANGVITITLPKTEARKPKRLEVKVS